MQTTEMELRKRELDIRQQELEKDVPQVPYYTQNRIIFLLSCLNL